MQNCWIAREDTIGEYNRALPGSFIMSEAERRAHAELQRNYFDNIACGFTQPIPADVEARTQTIVGAARLGEESRVLDIATGTGVLIAPLIPGVNDTRPKTGTASRATRTTTAWPPISTVRSWSGLTW